MRESLIILCVNHLILHGWLPLTLVLGCLEVVVRRILWASFTHRDLNPTSVIALQTVASWLTRESSLILHISNNQFKSENMIERKLLRLDGVVLIAISLLALIIFCGFVISIFYHGGKETMKINFGEFSVAFGTLFLALFTYVLAVTERDESRNERRRLRLKEQLQLLYSPLVAKEKDIIQIKNYGVQLKKGELVKIFDAFKPMLEFLALENLKEKINELYQKNFEGYKNEEWNNYIEQIIEIINEDTNTLIDEYNELTR